MMNKIQEVYIYPIKSFAGFISSGVMALHAGFEYDRRWMLLDEHNQFITQREIPELCMFNTQIRNELLRISHINLHIDVALSDSAKTVIETRVWNDEVKVFEQDPQVSEFITDILKKKVRLVKIVDEQSRSHYSKSNSKNYHVSLADGYPYLMLSDHSLNLLNKNTSCPFSVKRFRPNLVVTSSHPHEEDGWKIIHTPNASFENVKPCARCIMINVDPENAVVSKEPLKKLSGYRKKENNVFFGTNLACIKEGFVSVGETIKCE